jgi:N-acetylneuraminic acid mutarotase
VLLPDGSVLVTGGYDATTTTGPTDVIATTEILSADGKTWSAGPPMQKARYAHGCALVDGRVVVAGGNDTSGGAARTSAELFDPTTRTWTALPAMALAHQSASVVPLPSGAVLVAGDQSAEILDAAHLGWKPQSVSLPIGTVATGLADGSTLVVGKGTPYRYDPTKDAWTKTSAMKVPRYFPTLSLRTDGSVLVAGGFTVVAKTGFSAVAEVYTPEADSWTQVDSLTYARAGHTATTLVDGRVLVASGMLSIGTSAIPAELFGAADGVSCKSPDPCFSGACTDGFCCDRPCTGACESCKVPGHEGTCTPIDGAPLADHASCAPYKTCHAGACAATCASDADCQSGTICFPATHVCATAKGVCDGDHRILDLRSSATRDCAPFACTPSGDCASACATSGDCASGFVCDGNGGCVEPAQSAPANGGGGGGGCGVSRGASGSSAAIGALLAGALFLRRRRRLLAAAPLLAACGCDASAMPTHDDPIATASAKVSSTMTASMAHPSRVYASASRLADGRVIVVGGLGAAGNTVEIYDPAANAWSSTPPLATGRHFHTSSVLGDGTVLVAGGAPASGNSTSIVELYDPSANAWRKVAPLGTPRQSHFAALLPDGRVLVAGGASGDGSTMLSTAEIYDPTADAWTAAASMSRPHGFAQTTVLPDGRVFVAGGLGSALVEIYDPAADAWAPLSPLPAARDSGGAAALANGTVLIAGGANATSVLLYDPASGTSKSVGALSEPRLDLTVTAIAGGTKVLVAGGTDEISKVYAATALFDASSGTLARYADLAEPHGWHTATELADGRVLVVGGFAAYVDGDLSKSWNALSEIVNLVTGLPCSTDAQCASGACVDGVCCAARCGSPCFACDAPGHEGTCTPIDGAPRGREQMSCAPYGVCVAGGCATVCSGDADCDADHVCDPATFQCVAPRASCDGSSTITDPATGSTRDCAPYKCQRKGTCIARCASSDDCADGASCSDGVCVGAATSAASNGCAMRAGTGGAGTFALALAGAAGLLARRRARAR